jgi:hypothetical protein
MNKLRLLLVAALCAGAAQAQEARPALGEVHRALVARRDAGVKAE